MQKKIIPQQRKHERNHNNGEMDDNVDPASTLQVVSELIKHGKDFEQLYLPGYTHDLGGEYINKRVFRFFYRNCMNQ